LVLVLVALACAVLAGSSAPVSAGGASVAPASKVVVSPSLLMGKRW
jgi:hypothetical protein